MKNVLRLLALSLATLAACVVSTDDLKPKSASQCQAWEKPCGYRCVNAGDPATGCGNASCDPVDIQTDAAHCGACGHACGSGACTAAVCPTEAIARGPVDLRGVAAVGGVLYWIEAGTAGGQLVEWPTTAPFSSASVSMVVSGLDARTGAPSANRIASAGSKLYVAGSGGVLLPTDNLTLWEIDPGAGAKTPFYTEPATPPIVVDGLAAAGGAVYYVRSDDVRLARAAAGASSFLASGNPEALRGLAASGNDVYYGYSTAFGTLVHLNGTGPEQPLATGVGTLPHRLAVLQNGGTTQVFFASEADLSARLLDGTSLVSLYSGSGVPDPVDIAADASGAYFFDRNLGEVLEYRNDGWFFPLARGAQPFGIAVDGAFVYWTDASGSVLRVPK